MRHRGSSLARHAASGFSEQEVKARAHREAVRA